MIDLTEWMARARFPARPWLVVGKGPTFSRRDEFDLTAFNLVSLNHVVKALKVDVAHVADIDVIASCANDFENATWVLMPRYPHVDLAAARPIESFWEELPVLQRLDEEGRLVWYNLHTGPKIGDSPVIGCRHFSSEVVVEILGRLGARDVRTLGIDGGTGYSAEFSAEAARKLNTGAPNFDVQFFELERIAARYDMHLRPLIDAADWDRDVDAAARFHIEVVQRENARLERKVARLERRLDGIRKSTTWKAGRIVTAPFLALKRLRRSGGRQPGSG